MEKGGNGVPDEGIRFVRLEDMDPELAAHVRRVASDPEQLCESERAYAAEMKAGPIRLAFAEGPLPDGAVAAVVRAPGGTVKRMLVFSESSVTDRAISLARLAPMEDEREVVEPRVQRVLLVWDDQRVRGAGQTKQMRYRIPGRRHGDATRLLRAARQSPVEVPVP